MSTVVYMGTKVPEKGLIKEHTYKYIPDREMKEKILNDVKAHSKEPLEEYIIEVKVEVSFKTYDQLPKFYYENQLNDTKNP